MKVLSIILGLLLGVTCYAQNPSVFKVQNVDETFSATAFELKTPMGPVTITNRHVCDKQSILIAEVPGQEPCLILVKRMYDKHDLCVLQPVYGVPALDLANNYHKNQPVTVEGYPLGIYNLSTGPLLGPTRERGSSQVFVIYQGSGTFGSSGSPVVDSDGKVTGVISMVDSKTGKRGYMVPLEYIKDFLNIN